MTDRHFGSWPDVLKRSARRSVWGLCLVVVIAGPELATAQTVDTTGAAGVAGNTVNSNANDPSATSDSAGTPPPAGAPLPNGAFAPTNISGATLPSVTTASTNSATRGIVPRSGDAQSDSENPARQAPRQGEFEIWLQQITGHRIPRFGVDLLIPAARDFAVPATTTVPPDYALNVGDVVSVSLTGSMEGSANFEIDRDGHIFMPNVGSVSLVGVRYRDLKERIADAIGHKYRGYEVSVSIAKLRGVRVYVTGFANSPGAYTVNSLSTLANAVLAAGGPTAGGSFRDIKLYRNGHEVTDFDLYQLLRKGDRSRDPLLQNEDVLFIPPVGHQVAVVGSVNEEAIYELASNETLDDAVRLAGGVTSLADPDRLVLYRLSDRDTVGSREIRRPQASQEIAEAGDIIQILPQGSLARPLERQQVIVRIEGEVAHPGNYYVPPGTPLSKAVQLAGGYTERAYVYGTQFFRDSVRAQQRISYADAIDQMETAINTAPVTGGRLIDAAERQVQITAARAYLEQLRRKQPDGRLVLDVKPHAVALPGDLALENNDRIMIPPRIDIVGVFGAVYRPASFMLDVAAPLHLTGYIDKAGGPIRGADKGNIFVVHANGEVEPRRRGAIKALAMPGDTVFVPIKTQSNGVWDKVRDITTILFELGLSALAIKAIS